MAENKGSGTSPKGWDVAETATPGGSPAAPDWAQEGAAFREQHGDAAFERMAREAYNLPGETMEISGKEGQRDSTADRDPTNDAPQIKRDPEYVKAAAEDRADQLDRAFREQQYERQQPSTQERVGEAVREVRDGNYGVTKAIAVVQEKLDQKREQSRDRSRGGREL